MRITIAPYDETHVPAVKEFNRRIAAANGYREFQLPERPAPPDGGGRARRECFLAVSGEAVRGGFLLERQEFSFRGERRCAAHYRLPLSEGVLDRAYSGVGIQMLRAALRAEPLLFALGMGGEDRPLPRMLRASGWKIFAVPFYFRAAHPGRVLGELPRLRSSTAKRLAANVARWSGLGPLGIHAVQTLRKHPAGRADVEPAPAFEAWADEVWENAQGRYRMIAVRDSRVLNALYPSPDERFHRLRVTRNGAAVGWALVLDTAMRNDRHFGSLRVGSIADCLAAPEDADVVIKAVSAWLDRRGVDLVVSNQSHGAWRAALECSGFLTGPSNFVFAASKELAALLEPFEAAQNEIHINRGDGDGPIHL